MRTVAEAFKCSVKCGHPLQEQRLGTWCGDIRAGLRQLPQRMLTPPFLCPNQASVERLPLLLVDGSPVEPHVQILLQAVVAPEALRHGTREEG